jgi:O-antigen ligase
MYKFLYLVFIQLLVLNQLTSLSRGLASVYLFDLWSFIFFCFGIFYVLNNQIYISKKLLYLLILILFFIPGIVKLYFSVNFVDFLFSFFYFIRLVVYVFNSYFVYLLIRDKKMSLEFVLKSIVSSGLLLILLGFLQLIFIPDFEVAGLFAQGWDPHKNRLASSFLDPNFAGSYIVFVLWLLIFNKKMFTSKKFIILVSIFLLAILLTFSRSSWLFLAISFFMYSWIYNRKLIVFAILLSFLAYFAVPRIQTRLSGITDPSDSAYYRLISWSNSLEIIKDNYLVGIGYNSFRFASIDYGFVIPGSIGNNASSGSDSSILFIFATGGIFAFIWSLYTFYFLCFRSTNKVFWLVLLSGFLIQTQIINAMFFAPILFLFLTAFFISDFKFFF